jgi:hypothetical protein
VEDIDRFKGRPRVDSVSGLPLTRRLIKAAPKKRNADLREALEDMREAAVGVQNVRKERTRRRPESLRPFGARVDNAWGGLRSQLEGIARYEGEPEAVEAARILALLFAQGTGFLKGNFDKKFVNGQTLLDVIRDEKLAESIDKLAGKVALRYVRSAHTGLGEALGLGEGEVITRSTTALADALDVLAEAISDYVRVYAGQVKKKSPASVSQFLLAMAPLEQHRATYGNDASSGDEAEDEEGVEDVDAEDGTDGDGGDEDPNAPIPPLDDSEDDAGT